MIRFLILLLFSTFAFAQPQVFTYPNTYSVLNPFDPRVKYANFGALVTAGDVEIARVPVPSIFQTSITLSFPAQAAPATVAKVRMGFTQAGTTGTVKDLEGAWIATYTLPAPFTIPAGATTNVVYVPIFSTLTVTVTAPPVPVADTTPPVVSVTAPLAGATVVGTNALTASATDNVGVVGLQFLIDGANFSAEITAPPYTTVWNSTTVADGTHTVSAKARDAAGNSAASAAVSVKVSNAPPPPPPPPPLGISPDGSKITPASGGSLTTVAGVWTFGTATGAGGNLIMLNGTQARSGEATELYVLNGGNLYAFNSFSNWFQWVGTGWNRLSAAPAGAPHP